MNLWLESFLKHVYYFVRSLIFFREMSEDYRIVVHQVKIANQLTDDLRYKSSWYPFLAEPGPGRRTRDAAWNEYQLKLRDKWDAPSGLDWSYVFSVR